MTHEEYKEMLAFKALDVLSEAESRMLEAHLVTCAECRGELAELRDAAAQLTYTVAPVAPPSELRTRILGSVRDRQEIPLSSAPQPPGDTASLNMSEAGQGLSGQGLLKALPPPPPSPSTQQASQRPPLQAALLKRPAILFGAIAAALAVAIALTAVSLINLRGRHTKLQAEFNQLTNRNDELQTELARATTGRAELPPAQGQTEQSVLLDRNTELLQTEAGRLTNRNDELELRLTRLTNRNNELRAELTRRAESVGALQREITVLTARNSDMQARLAELTKRNSDLQTQLTALSRRNGELQAEANRLTTSGTAAKLELVRLTNRNNELQSDLARLTNRNNELQADLAGQRESETAFAGPNTRVVTLAGTGVAPRARARLTYDSRTGRTVFVANDLPPVPPGKAYQLWFIANNKPVSAGVFTIDAMGRAVLRSQVPARGRKASVFAVTLEQAGGSTSGPTGEKYLLSGA